MFHQHFEATSPGQ